MPQAHIAAKVIVAAIVVRLLFYILRNKVRCQ